MSEHLEDRAGAYVLGALSEAEVAEFEAHLATCELCRREVAELQQVVDVLPLAVEQYEPSAELRDRLLAAVEAEERAPAPTPIRPRFGLARVILPLAALAALVSLALWNLQLQQVASRNQQALAFQQRLDQALASGGTVHHLAGQGPGARASAALVQPRRGPAYLVVNGLRPPSTGQVYQVWLVRGTRPTSVGILPCCTSTPSVVHLTHSSAGYALAAVTVEPGPRGSPTPTGPKVLVGKLHA